MNPIVPQVKTNTLETAIKDEQDAIDFYESMIAKSNDDHEKTTVRYILAQEKHHKKMLESLRKRS
jgi:rubrerythrin